MKYRAKTIALAAVSTLLFTACTSGDNAATPVTPAPGAPTNATNGNGLSEAPLTLNIIGPGAFSTVTETGTIDLISGERRPGYSEVIDRWNELHPNVTLNINAIPWDNWQASLQTAALAGNADVLVHAASIPDIVEPLDRFIAAGPELADEVSQFALRRVGDNFEQLTPLGMSITVNPVVVVVDTQLFADWGVALPTNDWTLDDMLAAARATTGINPVSGAQNYGISMLPNNNVQQNFIWAARAMDATSIEFADSLVDSEINFDNQGVRDALDFLTELHSYSSPDYIEGFDLENTATADNNIAMYLNQTPFEEYNTLRAAGLLDRFMFVPLPDIASGTNAGFTSSHLGDWNMTIARNSDHQDWAWEFIRFMVEDPFVQDWLVRAGQIPNNIEGLSYVRDAMEPQYFGAIEHILTNQPADFSLQTSEWYDSTTLPVIPSAVSQALNDMFRGTQDSAGASAFIQQRVDEFVDGLR